MIMKINVKKYIFLLLVTAMTMLMYGCGEGEKIDTGLQVQDRLEEGDVLSESTGIDEIYYVYDSISGEYGLYDRATQEYVIEPQYMSIGPFSEQGLAAVCKNGYYGYIDSSGQRVIDLYYTTADMFQNNYAIVSTESGYGVIDESGVYTVSPQYAQLSWLNEGLLQYKPHEARKEGTAGNWKLYDGYGICGLDGVELSLPEYENFAWHDIYLFAKTEDEDNSYQVFDESGNALFGEGTSLPQVMYITDNQYGPYLARCKGTSEPTRFGFVYSPSHMHDEWYSYLNRDFQLLPGDPYQEAKQFNSSGYTVVSARQDWWGHETWGVINSEGTYVCDLPEIDLGSADDYYLETNGYFALAGGYTGSYGMDIESRYAVIDIVTQEITEYQSVEFISGTEYTVVQDAATGLYGLYDKNQLVEECVYDSIEVGANNKILLKRGGTETGYSGQTEIE